MTNPRINGRFSQVSNLLVPLTLAITTGLQTASAHSAASPVFTMQGFRPLAAWTMTSSGEEINSMQRANKGWPRNSSTGLRGGMSTATGGGLSTAPGGGASTGPNGGMSTGPGGGLSTGPGGGLSTGSTPYYSNIPPRAVYLKYLKQHGYDSAYKVLSKAWHIE